MLAGNLTGSFCIFHVIRFSERRRKDSAYDPQEDRDSHSGSARRARTYIDEEQRVHLHAYLLVRGKPDAKQREVLARDTGLDTETLYNWSVRLNLLLLQYSIEVDLLFTGSNSMEARDINTRCVKLQRKRIPCHTSKLCGSSSRHWFCDREWRRTKASDHYWSSTVDPSNQLARRLIPFVRSGSNHGKIM